MAVVVVVVVGVLVASRFVFGSGIRLGAIDISLDFSH
jgi:hypothetical protein